ncbi:bacillithiol system redox-active protein YtxJ [Lutibacter sp.]|uniref:bacillithiol system redox-active protein YtxJ n=1 Tax=Lutibacter sp. TaxID=1925666 RepID=UPI0027368452|nr:bacillithiol system redox-active protein YtxJ [Lutibacter sp.]MDP3313226.1 bacillithiol system redox-active protein YtxJ [Lutibacter sp.]
MGIFNQFLSRKSKVEQIVLPWNILNELNQLEEIINISHSKPVAIFKHSTRCGISRMVLRNFEKSFHIPTDILEIYYLDLLEYREISNAVAATFQIRHQSPQLLILKNGVTVYTASHNDIQAADLMNFV